MVSLDDLRYGEGSGGPVALLSEWLGVVTYFCRRDALDVSMSYY